MKTIEDIINENKNLAPFDAYQNACAKLRKYTDVANSTKNKRKRSGFHVSVYEKDALNAVFVFRVLLLYYKPYGEYQLSAYPDIVKVQDSTDKSVADIVKLITSENSEFLKNLEEEMYHWSQGIILDAVSYSLLSQRPIQTLGKSSRSTGNSNAFFLPEVNNIYLLLKEQTLEIPNTAPKSEGHSSLYVDEDLSQLISEYKGISPSDFDKIRSGLQSFINCFLVEDSADDDYKKFIKKSMRLRHYAWLTLQLYPVAVFISINLARSEWPNDKTFTTIESASTESKIIAFEKRLNRYKKIGEYLERSSRYCFYEEYEKVADDKENIKYIDYFNNLSILRKTQARFLEIELNTPDKKVLCERKKSHMKQGFSEDYLGVFYDKYEPCSFENPYIKFRGNKVAAYQVFRQLLDSSAICYETDGKSFLLHPNRALNWMIFEQLTGFLSAADYAVHYFGLSTPDCPGYTLRSFRGSHSAYILRCMEEGIPGFSTYEFLNDPIGKWDTLILLLSDFIRKTAESFSQLPLSKMPPDDFPDYIDWISNELVRQEETKRNRPQPGKDFCSITIDPQHEEP